MKVKTDPLLIHPEAQRRLAERLRTLNAEQLVALANAWLGACRAPWRAILRDDPAFIEWIEFQEHFAGRSPSVLWEVAEALPAEVRPALGEYLGCFADLCYLGNERRAGWLVSLPDPWQVAGLVALHAGLRQPWSQRPIPDDLPDWLRPRSLFGPDWAMHPGAERYLHRRRG